MTTYTIGLIIQSCISVITVAAVFAMTGLAGMFSLGQAAYMSISAYITFILVRMANLPILVSSLAGVLISTLLAFIISIPTLKLRRDYFALITVGFSQMVVSLVILCSDFTNGSLGFHKIPKVDNLIWIVLAITVLVVFVIRNIKHSRFGRMCIALKNDEIAARSFGINVYRTKINLYVLASATPLLPVFCLRFAPA